MQPSIILLGLIATFTTAIPAPMTETPCLNVCHTYITATIASNRTRNTLHAESMPPWAVPANAVLATWSVSHGVGSSPTALWV